MRPRIDARRLTPPLLPALAAALLLAASPAARAQSGNCDAIGAQIEAKIRASGVTAFTLKIVDADAKLPGKVVGSCELGTRKIVYTALAAASPPASASASASASAASNARPKAAAPKAERILTECKDGTVTMGGDCKK